MSRNRIPDFSEFVDDWDNGGQKTVSYKDRDISFSPELIFGYTVTARPVKGLSIDWLGKYVGRQYLDNTSDLARSLKSYLVNDLRSITPFRKLSSGNWRCN